MSENYISPKAVYASIGLVGAIMAVSIGYGIYDKQKERQLREKKLENEKLYFDKLTPEQVENLEMEKLVLKEKEVELKIKEAERRKTEDELKKTVTDFKKDIQSQIQRDTNEGIEREMRKTFDNWAGKYEDRLDKKIDRLVTRIDDLSDKYGGVKPNGSASTPSIQVVNAPNN